MRSKSGFTIVELIIVIAVVTIVVAIAIPTFASVIAKSDEAACLQEARSVFNELYSLDLTDGRVDGKDRGEVLPFPSTVVTPESDYMTNGEKVTKFVYTSVEFGYKVTYDSSGWGTPEPIEA